MPKERSRKPLTAAAVLAVLVSVLLAYAGNFHFVYGNGVSMRKVEKISWSLSETVINVDEVKGTPPLLLRAKFPLFTQAAERAAP